MRTITTLNILEGEFHRYVDMVAGHFPSVLSPYNYVLLNFATLYMNLE